MIERVYPGVFVTEVAFVAKSIEGVPTSDPAQLGMASAREPGPTLRQLFEWTEPLLHRSGPIGDAVRRAHAHSNARACAKVP